MNNENNRNIIIIAEAEDEKAKVEGIGEIEIRRGIGSTRVVVTAENGDVQIYNFTIDSPYAGKEVNTVEKEILNTANEKDANLNKEQLKIEWWKISVVFIIIFSLTIIIKIKNKE